jgi:hypothetical protein
MGLGLYFDLHSVAYLWIWTEIGLVYMPEAGHRSCAVPSTKAWLRAIKLKAHITKHALVFCNYRVLLYSPFEFADP